MPLKSLRLALVAVIPLCALFLGLLGLQRDSIPVLHAALPEITLAVQAAGWPPPHYNLSASADRDSGSADMDADGGNVVVVWAEGSSAQGLNDGVIMMAWSRAGDSTWRTLVVPPEGNVGYVHYHPTVALAGATAHVAWVREDTEGAGRGNTQVRYARCSLISGACGNYAGITADSQTYAHLAPDIAVDPLGVPHVVWVRQQAARIGTVWYNNRVGGAWGALEQVSGGSTACPYTQDNPAIAVDGKHVYVTWDENVRSCAGMAGIYFRLRGNSTGASGSGINWWPQGGDPWGKQLSQAASTSLAPPDQIDGFPAIGVGEGWVYVLWERLAYSQTVPLYGAVYTYSLAYRVYTGTVPQRDWWPGGASAERWAVLPFTATSATDTAEYYAGLRPALDMVGRTPHIAWHHWDASALLAAGAELGPLGELPSEHLVDSQRPYRVSYATYRSGTDPLDLDGARAGWVSKTLQVFGSDRILAWPSLALASTDGGRTHVLHAALHQRKEFVPAVGSYAWDVMYTNDTVYYSLHFPAVFKRASVGRTGATSARSVGEP
jgi:hypothetical protein